MNNTNGQIRSAEVKNVHLFVRRREYQVKIFCSNLSSIYLAENPIFHARTKHIEVHCHFINVLEGEIIIVPTKTEKQTANILTKSLNKTKFEKFWEALGMVCRTTLKRSLPWGGVLKEGKATFYNILHYARVRYLPWSSLDLIIN